MTKRDQWVFRIIWFGILVGILSAIALVVSLVALIWSIR